MSPDQMKARLTENFPDAVEIKVIDTTGTEDHYD